MTIAEIQRTLHVLRYKGGWSLRGLADQSGLAVDTISRAFSGEIGESAQSRLSAVLPIIKETMPVKDRPKPKRKPGHFKRYLIRYYNLMRWLDVIEKERGIEKRFVRRKQGNMSRDRAAFVCHRLDFQMKYHLLTLFGEKLRAKKVVLADCYQAEKWIERIQKALPGQSQLLFKNITQRYANRQNSRAK